MHAGGIRNKLIRSQLSLCADAFLVPNFRLLTSKQIPSDQRSWACHKREQGLPHIPKYILKASRGQHVMTCCRHAKAKLRRLQEHNRELVGSDAASAKRRADEAIQAVTLRDRQFFGCATCNYPMATSKV